MVGVNQLSNRNIRLNVEEIGGGGGHGSLYSHTPKINNKSHDFLFEAVLQDKVI